MKPRLNITTLLILRAVAILCLGIFIFAAIYVGFSQGILTNTTVNNLTAESGVLNLRNHDFNDHKPVLLNGEWEYYSDIFHVADKFDYSLLESGTTKLINMPFDSISDSSGSATYRLILQTGEPFTNFSFYLPNYNEDFAIYVNGTRVRPVNTAPKNTPLYSPSYFLFRIDFPIEPGTAEVIISANSSEGQALLYRNMIVFGPSDIVSDYVTTLWRDDTFLIGIIIILVIVGLVFILMRTKLDMLSSFALFDTFLAFRIILGFNITTYFVQQFFPWLKIGNVDFVGLQYAAFFATGAFGCLLSQAIYDPEKKLPSWPIKTQIGISIAGTIFTLLFYRSAPSVCIIALLILLFGSFLIVTWHVYCTIKHKHFSGYYIFQTIKTYFVGLVMTLDILILHGQYYNSLVYSYVFFLLMHLLTRLMDSNLNYSKVEELNHNLEKMIDERTLELTEANKRLSEISVRDPLTQAYNRLYFEQLIEKTLANYSGEVVYLCMFDFDHFKRINDIHGHDAGDEQLKFIVKIADEIVPDTATLSRIGGEEFVILFVGEPYESVAELVEKLRLRLELDAKENPKRTTASFGLVKYRPDYTKKDLMKLADQCMYCAKENGRNRVCTIN